MIYLSCEKNEINKKRPGLANFLKMRQSWLFDSRRIRRHVLARSANSFVKRIYFCKFTTQRLTIWANTCLHLLLPTLELHESALLGRYECQIPRWIRHSHEFYSLKEVISLIYLPSKDVQDITSRTSLAMKGCDWSNLLLKSPQGSR